MIRRNPFPTHRATVVSRVVLPLILSLLALPGGRQALAQSTSQDIAISSDRRAAIVRRVAATVEEHYVFEDMGKEAGDSLRSKLDNGGYDSITDSEEIISQLTADLQSISRDLHMRIYPYRKNPSWGEPDSIARRDRELAELRRENFGFHSVELLPGNIGYVRIHQFYDPRHAAPTAIAAMNFLANCDALIVDLRDNGGGYSTMKQLICSYLFDEPTRLMDFYGRDGLSERDWTLSFVQGPKLTDVPVYVLVSRLTFSAAEGFAFTLKNRGRARIIGERTPGGANAVEYCHFSEEGITVRVPTIQPRDPEKGTTWEGSGVEPDIEVPAFEQGLIIANIEALKQLLASEADSNARYSQQWALEDYQRQLNPIVLDSRQLPEYVGEYGAVKITCESGYLYYQRPNRRKEQLVPMGNDDFKIYDPKGCSKYRIQFTRSKSGRIAAFYVHDWDGDRYDVVTKNVK
jgi:hypothetical protein